MSTSPTLAGLRSEPAARTYTLICSTALLVLLLALLQRGVGIWSLFPVTVAGLALLACWRLAPLMLLLSLAGVLYARWEEENRWRPQSGVMPITFSDFILCGTTLAYIGAHFRLQALVQHVFPLDPRRQGLRRARKKKTPKLLTALTDTPENRVPRRRSAQRVSPWEIGLFLLALPFWAGLAILIWQALPRQAPALELNPETVGELRELGVTPGSEGPPNPFEPSTSTPSGLAAEAESVHVELAPELWRGIVLFWASVVPAIILGGLFDYFRLGRMTPREAALLLQDTLWRETRREQRLLGRWLAWSRLGQQLRKGSE